MELFSPRHLLVILLIVLVVFGTKKLRSIGSDLGGAVKGFKEGMKSGDDAAAQAKGEIASTSTGQTIEGEVKKETTTKS